MISTQMGMHNRSVMVAVYGSPCAIPLFDGNQCTVIYYKPFPNTTNGNVARK
jgi:hypothetical protein